MLGSLFLFLLSLPQGGKGGEMGGKGGGKAYFTITFSILLIQKSVKK